MALDAVRADVEAFADGVVAKAVCERYVNGMPMRGVTDLAATGA